MWYSTSQPQKTNQQLAYEGCDKKNIGLIKKVCVETDLEGVVWWDTTGQGLEYEVKYLRLRGLIVVHPSHVLVRFKE